MPTPVFRFTSRGLYSTVTDEQSGNNFGGNPDEDPNKTAPLSN